MGWFLSVASSSIPIQIEIYEEKDIYHQYVIKNCRLFLSGKIDFENNAMWRIEAEPAVGRTGGINV